jgi:PAS domain S-box-containing protein
VSATRRALRLAGAVATAAVLLLLGWLEAGRLPGGTAQRASDVLQLGLASLASLACLAAAARPGARAFWAAFGLGCAAWATGQGFWVVRGVPFQLEAGYAEADLAFTASTALFVAAFVLRPDRRDHRQPLLVIDVLVVLVAMFYLFFQVAYVHLALGEVPAYEAWSTFLYDFRGLALLPALLWALHFAEPAWRPVYVRLAPAFVLLQLGGSITNQSFTDGIAGPYHAGFYDLPWTLPFVWIGFVALRYRLDAAVQQPPPSHSAWQSARRATVVAFVAVLLFPLVEILLAWGDEPRSPRSQLRAAAALAGTLLVAGLYLARQLFLLNEAQKVLREGEERYRALLDTGEDVVGVYGPDMRVLYVSGAIEGLGYRPEERIGKNALDVVHPDDAERVRAAVRTVLRSPGERVMSVYRARVKDGSYRDLEVELVNRLEEPAVRGLVANFRDVTERRRTEAAREHSLSLLEATLESTTDGILVADLEGQASRFNQKFSAMWRVSRELLAARDDRALASVLDQLQEPQPFLTKVQELQARPDTESLNTLRFRDGRVFEHYSLPQRLAGEVVGRVWSFRDVSERAHAEQAAARLVAIIEATPDLVGTSDAAGRPLYLNRAGRRMLGLADDERLADHISRYYPAREVRRVMGEVLEAAIRDGTWSGEIALRQRDGLEVPVLQVIVAHRDGAGAVEFLSTIARDIRERKQAEEELQRGQTMAALGSLVAGVAHEVRNPLFGISSTLDAFEARFAGRTDHRPYVAVFREQLDRLTSLMNDLLEYAKPGGGELAYGPIERVVELALTACTPIAERARVVLESRMAPGLPALWMDAKRLSQVFRNLVENGVQHSPAGGEVRVGAQVLRRGGETRVECVVEDKGPGFRTEDLPHLFEPFFTRRHGGTGLGLSIVYRIVTDHGGTVVARNRPGGGACVTVGLPVASRHSTSGEGRHG